MGDNKDSSVLFSLKELMNLEEDRVRREQQERQRAVQAEAAARIDAERRAQQEEEARTRAEVERQRVEEQRLREEAVRLEAIRHAEMERARVDAENAARLEALRAQQEHERHLAVLHDAKSKKRLTFAVIGTSAGLILVMTIFGVVYKNQVDRHERDQAQKQLELTEKTALIEKQQHELQEQNDSIATLDHAVRDAKDNEARRLAEKALQEAKDRQKKMQEDLWRARSSGHGASPSINNTPRPACTCQAGDPLCACQ